MTVNYPSIREAIEMIDWTEAPLIRRLYMEQPTMRQLWHVYIVNLEDDSVFEVNVLSQDPSMVKLKAVEQARKDLIELAEVDVDDMDIVVQQVGVVRE